MCFLIFFAKLLILLFLAHKCSKLAERLHELVVRRCFQVYLVYNYLITEAFECSDILDASSLGEC